MGMVRISSDYKGVRDCERSSTNSNQRYITMGQLARILGTNFFGMNHLCILKKKNFKWTLLSEKFIIRKFSPKISEWLGNHKKIFVDTIEKEFEGLTKSRSALITRDPFVRIELFMVSSFTSGGTLYLRFIDLLICPNLSWIISWDPSTSI